MLHVRSRATFCLNLGGECSWTHASIEAVWVGVERQLLFSWLCAWEVTALTVEKGSPGLEQLEAIPENIGLDIEVWVLINTILGIWKGHRPP